MTRETITHRWCTVEIVFCYSDCSGCSEPVIWHLYL